MHLTTLLFPLLILASTNVITSPLESMQNDVQEDYDPGKQSKLQKFLVAKSEKEEQDYGKKEGQPLLPSRQNSSTFPAYDVAELESEIVRDLIQEAFFGGFNAIKVIESLEPSKCLEICLDEVSSMSEQPFVGQRSVDEAGDICSHFDVLQRCLHHNTTCKNALLGVTAAIFDYLCTVGEEELNQMLPCLYSQSTVIYYTCDNQCTLGELIAKTSSKSDTEVSELLDSDENELIENPNLRNLCSASACFINCTQEKIEKACPFSRASVLHHKLQHKLITAMVNHTMTLNPAPGMKSIDAYTLLVSSILPRECQRLKLLPEGLSRPTPIVDLVDNADFKSAEETQPERAEGVLGNGGADRTILNNGISNQTKPIYVQTFSLKGHSMKLQCQVIDLETQQNAMTEDFATLMSVAAESVFNEFGLRSVQNDHVSEEYIIHGNMSEFHDHVIASNKSQIESFASSHRVLFPLVTSSLVFTVILQN